MDSDFSLIEIAGEDDSLLQPLPGGNDAVSSLGVAARGNTTDYFLCSPLQVPRSNSKAIEAASEGLGEAKSYRDGVNKENFNVEKADAVKLSIEPQQMKKKKKGGGYNLRKSLAWDRAFFTEEGVLDAAELSMISGSFSKSRGQMLTAIEEEPVSNFSDLRALEDNLFKELPPATSEKAKEIGRSPLPKKRNNETPTSVATRKVLSTHDVNRGSSKRSACARPLAPTSLKRPANLVTTKTTVKDSKVSKLPVHKPSPSAPPPSRTGKNSTLSASDSKRSQTSQPAVNAQKNFGLKGSLNKNKSVPNNSKVGPAGKSLSTKIPLGQAKRNVANSVKRSPTTVQSTLNTEAQTDLGIIPNATLPTGFGSTFRYGESGKTPSSLPKFMEHTEIQTERPTGLRMPSPSLGFFNQSNPPTSESPSKLTPQLCNVPESTVTNLRKPCSSIFAIKPPLAPRHLKEVTTYGATTVNSKASGSSSGCSVFTAFEPALRDKVESNSQVDNMQKVDQKVVTNKTSYGDIESQNKLQGGLDQQMHGKAGQYTTKATFEKEAIVMQINVVEGLEKKESGGDGCLLQLGTLLHLDKNNTSWKAIDGCQESTRSELENQHFNSHSGSEVEATRPLKNDIADHQLAEDKPYHLPLKKHDVSSEFASVNCNVYESFEEQAEVVNLLTNKTDPISSSRQMSQESVADVNLNVQVSGLADMEKFNTISNLTASTEQEKDDVLALDKEATQSSVGEARKQLSLVSNVADSLSNSELIPVINIQQNVVVSDGTKKPELLEFPESISRLEALEDGVTLHVGDFLFSENSIVLPPSDEQEDTSACERDPKSFGDPSPVSVTKPDCRSNRPELFRCENLKNTPAVGILPFESDSHEVGLEKNESLTNLVAAEDVNVSGQEISNISSSQSPMAGVSSINHTVELADVEVIKLVSQVESPCPGSTSQPLENLCPNQEDSPMFQVCVPSAEDDVSKPDEDEDKQMIDCSSEMKSISSEEILCTEANGLLFEKTRSPEALQIMNISTVYLEVSSDDVSERENHDLSLHEKMDGVVEELLEVNNVVRDQDENLEFQSLFNQTEEAKTSIAGVGLTQPFQEDHNTQVLNWENELLCQSCSVDEIEKVDNNNSEVLNVETDHDNVLEQYEDPQIEPKPSTPCAQIPPVVQGVDHEEHKEDESVEGESISAEFSLQTEPQIVEQLLQNHGIGNNKLDLEVNSLLSDSWENRSDNEVSGRSTIDSDHNDATRANKKSVIDKKQENLVIKPPTNAVPFSDEWLAALEAAGEEILTMKSGAVQNSPQDRSQPEPGPWSPVKRKHNQPLGPFDCTKHINH